MAAPSKGRMAPQSDGFLVPVEELRNSGAAASMGAKSARKSHETWATGNPERASSFKNRPVIKAAIRQRVRLNPTGEA
jgi:hypothetical protein